MTNSVNKYDARASMDFSRARLSGLMNQVLEVLSGQSRQLLEYEQVREKLHLGGPVYRGVQAVPLDKIIGSVDRYQDFDWMFNPTQTHTRSRWYSVNKAWYKDVSLPPVLLYKVGEVYFVVDGNHRVSVARSKNQLYIDAEVRECESRVAVSGETRPEDLERLGAKVEFLERTQVDRFLPSADVTPTLLGGYDRLIEHIAVHRYFMGIEAQREISDEDAVKDWYANLYQPVEELVVQSGVLDHLPGRTATDVYLWVMDHLHYLREQGGYEDAEPEEAARDFLTRLDDIQSDE